MRISFCIIFACSLAFAGGPELRYYVPKCTVLQESKAGALERQEALVRKSSANATKLTRGIIVEHPQCNQGVLTFIWEYKNSITDLSWKLYALTATNVLIPVFTNKQQFFRVRVKDKDLPKESQ